MTPARSLGVGASDDREERRRMALAFLSIILYDDHRAIPSLLGRVYRGGLEQQDIRKLDPIVRRGLSLGDRKSDYWHLLLFNKK